MTFCSEPDKSNVDQIPIERNYFFTGKYMTAENFSVPAPLAGIRVLDEGNDRILPLSATLAVPMRTSRGGKMCRPLEC